MIVYYNATSGLLRMAGQQLQREERITEVKKTRAQHERNRTAAEARHDYEGVRIANAGIERCDHILRVLA